MNATEDSEFYRADGEAASSERTRDFQARRGESFWDISQEEFDAYAKPIEAEKINKGEKHHV